MKGEGKEEGDEGRRLYVQLVYFSLSHFPSYIFLLRSVFSKYEQTSPQH